MSRTMRTFCLTMSCLALTLVPSMARAVVVIDTFDVAQTATDTSANGNSVGNTAGPAASIIGGAANGYRDVFATKTSPANNGAPVEGQADALEGTFSVNRGSGVAGNVLVMWDGGNGPLDLTNPLNSLQYLLNADLTEGGSQLGILVRVLRANFSGQSLTMTLYTDATNYSSQSFMVNAVAPPVIDAQFPFAAFVPVVGVANPALIRAITLEVSGGPTGADLTIDLLQTYVPEPASASLLGVGLVATLARFRRRRREVAVS